MKRAPLGKTLGREGMVHSLEIAVERYRNTNDGGEVMSDSAPKDAGTIQVLLQQLNDIRLPRALDLKKKVDRGEKLDSYDINFLETVLADASSAQGLIARHPGIQAAGRASSSASTARSPPRRSKTNRRRAEPWARKTQRR